MEPAWTVEKEKSRKSRSVPGRETAIHERILSKKQREIPRVPEAIQRKES